MDDSLIKYWNCKVTGFNIQGDIEDYRKSYINLTLEENGKARTLRFLNPRQINLETYGSNHEGDLNIHDCSADGLEQINLSVAGRVINLSNFSFWAESVIEVSL